MAQSDKDQGPESPADLEPNETTDTEADGIVGGDTKRNTLFSTLNAVVNKFDQSAQKVIDNLRQ